MPSPDGGHQAAGTQRQTDTNNNSNKRSENKSTNGARAQELLVASSEVVALGQRRELAAMPPPMASPESILTIAAAAASAAASAVAAAPPVPPRPPSIAAIKQQQHQLANNNNNNNNNTISTAPTKLGPTQPAPSRTKKPLDELAKLIKDVNFDRTTLSNEELIGLVKSNHISIYKLESFLGKDNASRCVDVRRLYYRLVLAELDKLDQLGICDRAEALLYPKYQDLDYERVNGACCENVIGHVKVPVGLAGPLVLDGEEIFVPLATTEGCLVASTCRGLSALRKSGGVTSRVRRDFMTRAPIIRFKDQQLGEALNNVERAIRWLEDKANKEKMRQAFNLTSSHGRFINYTIHPVSREIHIRFEAQTGDAMGMNMCSKGVESALKEMQRAFPSMEIVTLSGNMCTDKKAAGINWINGRGKAVECNAELPANVVKQVFKVSVDELVDRWKAKVMIGSAMAASIGGFNSQAANILTAIFIATGQDPAQNVTSSNCMLILEKDSKGSLVVCCTMPSIECGTVGGGTILGDQSRYLQMMGVRGPTPKSASIATAASGQRFSTANPIANDTLPTYIDTNEYTNARKLARVVCATVMAGELSLLAALTEGTLVKSHMRHNRSSTNVINSSSPLDDSGQTVAPATGSQAACANSSPITTSDNHCRQARGADRQTPCSGQVNNFTTAINHQQSYISNIHKNNITINNNNNNHYLNNNFNSSICNSLDNCEAEELGSNCSNNLPIDPTPQSDSNHHQDSTNVAQSNSSFHESSIADPRRSASGAGFGGGGGGSRGGAVVARGPAINSDNVGLC